MTYYPEDYPTGRTGLFRRSTTIDPAYMSPPMNYDTLMDAYGRMIKVPRQMDYDRVEVKKTVINECSCTSIPSHLKTYYNQLIDYWCQKDDRVKEMRDKDKMKTCCILDYINHWAKYK